MQIAAAGTSRPSATQVVIAETHTAHVGYPAGPAVAIRPAQRGGLHLRLVAADDSYREVFLEGDQCRELADALLDAAWRSEQTKRGRPPADWPDAATWTAARNP